MATRRKPKLAVWKFASCDGCQLQLLSCEDELLPLAGAVDIVTFAEATSRRDDGGPLDVVLVNPRAPVPADKTVQVFRALAASPLGAGYEERPSPPCVTSAEDLIARIDGGNDLEAAACRVVPAIADVLGALRRSAGCHVAAMSGAGPTCFGVFTDREAARSGAEHLSLRHPDWWIVPAVLR